MESDRVKYHELIRQADEQANKGKIFSAMIRLEDAKYVFKDDPGRFYRMANYYASFGYSVLARKYYHEVLEVMPNDFKVMNNLVELSFLKNEWGQCILDIDKLAKAHPAAVSQYPLLAIKQLICLDKLNRIEELVAFRKLLLKRYSHMSDNPLYYYLHIHDHLSKKNQVLAEEWIAKFWRVFQHVGLYHSWNKALIDAGYLNEYDVMLKKGQRVVYIPFSL